MVGLKPRAFFEIFFGRFEQAHRSAAEIAPKGTNTPLNRRLQTFSCPCGEQANLPSLLVRLSDRQTGCHALKEV